ncbi:MAG: membrane dipeptidase, partial [Synergistaceae bacterium]|nr:membrane dipeptidase [Synergistaceae bacterium]
MTEEMQNIEMNDKETPDTETPDARSQDIEQQHARMQFLDKAKKLHEWCFVADGHNDLLPRVLFKRAKGRTKVIEQDYLPLFREGRVNLVVSSLFIGDEYLPEMGLRRALGCISALRAEMEESPGLFSLCRNTAEIEAANERGELAILLSFEGLEPIGNDLSLLGIFHELGVRGVGIAWSRRSYAADG